MSMLFWAEHCVECAAPDCYESCDLYQPRADKRCRRFTYGAMKNRKFSSLRNYGVEISFKKWAKLEAYGNLALHSARTVRWSERLIEWCSPAGNVGGRIVERITKKPRWGAATHVAMEELVRRLHARRAVSDAPDAFLLEVYNPSSVPVRMQLNFASFPGLSAGQKSPPGHAPSFVTTVALPSGYSRHQIDFSLLRFVAEQTAPFLISMIPEADSNARLVFLMADFVQFSVKRKQAPESGKIKCVVWDLDNTLWKGVLVEGDTGSPRPDVVSLLRRLDERGILLSIASKNDYGSAWRKLQEHGISDLFVASQINWSPKSQNIRAIAERLNIGLDTFAFVDDSAFERDEVKRSLPDVVCVDAREIPTLIFDPRFQGSTSADSRRRRQFYQEADLRVHAQAQFGSDYLGFLAACEITLEIARYSPEESQRVAELVQRTNQLNVSGRKYSRNQLEEILADGHLEKFVLRSADRYGSYGTVGFALVESNGETIRILDFMLSCRVQGKLLEQAFFSHLFEHHNPERARFLWINFQETARNKPAQQVLESLGFSKCASNADGIATGMIYDLRDSLRCEFIRVHCLAGAAAALPPSASNQGQKPEKSSPSASFSARA